MYLSEVPNLASLDPLKVVLRPDEAVDCLGKDKETDILTGDGGS